MNTATPIRADQFLDQVITALIAADAPALRQLESVAALVDEPRNRAQYHAKSTTFAALLDATARNLRFLRRVVGKQPFNSYAPSPRQRKERGSPWRR